jgi:fumigallin biosynthesis monooxygenase-like protein
MAELVNERICAEVEGEIVVFLIGIRINRLWKVWRWFPVMAAMPRMLQELAAHPELGMLSARGHFGLRNQMVLQYWKSAEHLRAYAHAAGKAHLPAWQAFNRRIGTDGDVGIWHETYVVPKGHAESVYVNMPRYGLGLAGALFPAKGERATASKRLAGVRTPS